MSCYTVARYHLTFRRLRSGFRDKHLWLPVETFEKAEAVAGPERNLILLFVTNALGFMPESVTWEQIELVRLPMWGEQTIPLAL